MRKIQNSIAILILSVVFLCGASGGYAQERKTDTKNYPPKDRHAIESLIEQKEKGRPQMARPEKTIFILNDEKVIDVKAVESLNPESVLSLKILYSYSDKGAIDCRIVLIKTETTTTSKEVAK